MKDIRLSDNCNPKFVIELSKKYNLGIEIQSFYDPYCNEHKPDIKQQYLGMLENFTYGKSLHAPFWELNIGSRMVGIIETTVEMFNYAYNIAQDLGCTDIIVHNGYIPNTYAESGWIMRASQQWKKFLSDKKHMKFYVENQFEQSSSMMCKLVDEVNMENFKICLDIGHINAHSIEPISQWIRNAGDRIGYVHFHNNDGLSDEHNGVDKGTMQVFEIIDMLEKYSYNAIWCIETIESELESSYLTLKNR